jgi:hypothetical protein
MSMNLEPIRVRRITAADLGSLGSEDPVYVADSGFALPILVDGYIRFGALKVGPDEITAWVEEGKTPLIPVRTVYGPEFHQKLDLIFLPDEDGIEMPYLDSAGTWVKPALFIPGVDEHEAIERVKRALRAEFGPGVVELWNIRSGPVRDVRWDVWEVQRKFVLDSTSSRKKPSGSVVETDRRLVASGIRDGHQNYYRSRVSPGWELDIRVHQPQGGGTETL